MRGQEKLLPTPPLSACLESLMDIRPWPLIVTASQARVGKLGCQIWRIYGLRLGVPET